MSTFFRKDPHRVNFQSQIEKDPKDRKDNPDDAPESGDKMPE